MFLGELVISGNDDLSQTTDTKECVCSEREGGGKTLSKFCCVIMKEKLLHKPGPLYWWWYYELNRSHFGIVVAIIVFKRQTNRNRFGYQIILLEKIIKFLSFEMVLLVLAWKNISFTNSLPWYSYRTPMLSVWSNVCSKWSFSPIQTAKLLSPLYK